jgi:hypothetical protein
MQNEKLNFASFAKDTKNYETIRNAVRAGLNVGCFVFQLKTEVKFFSWRLRGDTIEIRPENIKLPWKILHNEEYDREFKQGVFGGNVDWSMPENFVSEIKL